MNIKNLPMLLILAALNLAFLETRAMIGLDDSKPPADVNYDLYSPTVDASKENKSFIQDIIARQKKLEQEHAAVAPKLKALNDELAATKVDIQNVQNRLTALEARPVISR